MGRQRALGLDLSLTATGYAFAIGGQLAGGGLVTSKGKAGASLEVRAKRIAHLAAEVHEVVSVFGPDIVVVEAPSFGSRHGQQHERSGLWWRVVLDTIDAYPVATVAPTTRAKYATGKGNANKDTVLSAVVRRYSTDDEEWVIADNNVADAVVLAAMGSRYLGAPIEVSLPEANLAAMDGASWPNR